MAIVQISKIQQRSGNLVDLPQLDEAEFGFASDEKRLFIGKTTEGVENIEVLTSYSDVDFSQINGAVGNLDIDPLTASNGQVLAFNGTDWVNRGGNAGGLITLGEVSNVKITGGAIDYVLTTDGIGNLSWTPKSSIISYIENATTANPCVITTTQDNFFVEGAEVTITSAVGMTELNGNSYFIDVITANTFALYSDPSLSSPVDATGYTPYAYTSVTATTASTNYITVGDTSSFSQYAPVIFLGTTFGNITANVTYYIATVVSSTEIVLSTTEDGGNIVTLTTDSGSANMYTPGGRAISVIGGSGGSANAGGTQFSVQYNNSNLLDGDATFTYDFANKILSVVQGNVDIGNLTASNLVTAEQVVSTIANGVAPPFVVTSKDRVPNLNVSYANVSDYEVVTNQTTGTFYPVFINGSSSGNYALGANSAFSFNALTGDLSATLLTGTLTTQAQPNVTSLGNSTEVTVAGNLNPSANVTYNLGNATSRWNDLYLSGSTVYLGNSTITSNGSGVVITNASGGTFTVGGTGAANSAAIVNGSSNVIVEANSNVNISSSGNANVLVVTGSGVNVTGTLNATGVVTGNGSGLSDVNASNITTGTLDQARLANSSLTVNSTSISLGGSATITANTTQTLTFGNYLTGTSFNGGTANTIAVDATATNTGSKVVARDSDGSFSANIVTATLNGSATSAATAGTVTTNAQPNITSVSTAFTNLTFANAQTISGNNLTLTTGANTNPGTIIGNWSLSVGSQLQATYADLAEYYTSDQNYEPGTVLEFGGEKEVTLASDGTNKVAGVVTTNPAYVMNSGCPGDTIVAIALQGRVPCKVRGTIKKGDMLISGGNGFARPSSSPSIGTVIGKAIQNFDGVEGVIEVAVGRL